MLLEILLFLFGMTATAEDRREKGKTSILLLGQDFLEDCMIKVVT